MRALRVLQHRSEALAARVEAEVGGAIGTGLGAAAAVAANAMDRAIQGAIERGAAPACAAGCSWCCHVHVDASAPEIFAAAAFVAASPRAAELRGRLSSRRAHVEALDDEARWAARIPCALLDGDGRCAIYEARPLRCRAFHVRSADPCRAAFEGDEREEPAEMESIARPAAAVEAGYDRALAASGIGAEAYRFEIGLALALDDPSTEARWRAGEGALSAACARAARRGGA
jgi:Fe-S-cluster containining protein